MRSWATPLALGLFTLMAGTGVLMFFNVERGLVAGVHEWCAWLFLAAVGSHLWVNRRALTGHLRSMPARLALAGGVIVVVASLFSYGLHTGADLRNALIEDLANARIETLADLTQTDVDGLRRRLERFGASVPPGATLRDVAGDDRGREIALLELVFVGE